jgi:hypothetical protein
VLRAAEAMVEVTERSSLFLNLVNAFARRQARFADPTDLDTAVDSARQAVAQPEPGSVRLLRHRITPAHLQTIRAPVLPRWRPVRKADSRGVPWCPSRLIIESQSGLALDRGLVPSGTPRRVGWQRIPAARLGG